MEISRYWREQGARVGFRMEVTLDKDGAPETLKMPGGAIRLDKDPNMIYKRLVGKGFTPEVAEEILLGIFGGVTAEAPIPVGEVGDGLFKLLRGEIGEENRSEVELCIDSLPG